MKNRHAILTISFFLLASTQVQAQTNNTASTKIDSTFASYNTTTPGVAVMVIKDGQVVFNKGYGMADLSNNIPVTSKTVFNLASVSKQFTAFAIYLLENDGLLSFEDDIRKYLPEIPVYEKPIRIRHLMSHTSGLRDQGALASIAGNYIGADLNTVEQNLKLLSHQKGLNFLPGTVFSYSNTNYVFLAEIVHRVSKKTFAEFVKEKIFKPLGMSSTLVWDDYSMVVKNKADSYERTGDRYRYKALIESNAGASNLLTTAEDLVKWVLNFDNPVVGNKKMIEAFNQPSLLDDGSKVIFRIIGADTIFHAKGQNISKDKGSYMGFGGHTAGFRIFLGRYPLHKLAVVQLSNDEDNEKLGGRWDIADYFIEPAPVEQIQPVAAPAAPNVAVTEPANHTTALSAFTGNYFSDELEATYHIGVKDDKLVMKHKRLYDLVLKRIGEHKFSGSGPYTFAFEISFIKDDTGMVTGFSISNFGVKNLQFQKIE